MIRNNRIVALLALCLLVAIMLTSCYAKVVVLQEAAKESVAVASAPVEENKVEEKKTVDVKKDDNGRLKTGLSFVTSLSSSKEQLAQSDATFVAVAVDGSGVIQSCVIDAVQAKVRFDENGQITTDISVPVESKNELGPRYGMAKASGIGKEWNEQMKSLADYVVGKTAAEVKGIAFKDGKPEDVDLASSVTVYMGGYISAIADAAENAEDRGARKGDKLELVTYTTLTSSKSATDEKDGCAQADISAMMLTLDGDKITSAYVDVAQAKVTFSNKGVITADTSVNVQTKNQLKEGYGMGRISSIGADWYQQAASYASYITGKTVDEALGIAVNEKSAPADADLASSVTMSIGSFNELLKKVSR